MPVQAKSSVKIINFQQVFENRKIRAGIVYRINGEGIGRYIYNNKELTDAELDKLFPIHFRPASSNKNPDGRKIYL